MKIGILNSSTNAISSSKQQATITNAITTEYKIAENKNIPDSFQMSFKGNIPQTITKFSEKATEKLLAALNQNDLKKIAEEIENGANVNDLSVGFFLPLSQAKSSDAVKLLIEKGADVNLIDKDELTPLECLATDFKIEPFWELIKHVDLKEKKLGYNIVFLVNDGLKEMKELIWYLKPGNSEALKLRHKAFEAIQPTTLDKYKNFLQEKLSEKPPIEEAEKFLNDIINYQKTGKLPT